MGLSGRKTASAVIPGAGGAVGDPAGRLARDRRRSLFFRNHNNVGIFTV